MPSKIQVDQIAGATGSTVTLPSGQTLDLSSGTVNLPSASLSALNATNLTSGTVPSARLSLTSSDLPTVPTTKGGTGLTTLGTANQVLRMNSGATALEFGTVSSSILQIKRATYTSTAGFNSTSAYAQFGTLEVSITPTASNSSFWINAVAYASPSNHDTPWKYNISDSQVGSTTAIFTDVARNHAHLGNTSHFGVGSFASDGLSDDYWLPQHIIGGMYTPASNNSSTRIFRVICRNSSNGTLFINKTQIESNTQSSGAVSTIEVWEIANGIYS
jgi:hypothetical protein